MKKETFNIDAHFVEAIEVIYDNLVAKGVNIVYIGKFNHSAIKMFSSMAEQDMEKTQMDTTTKHRVYHAIVEILQNMSKHSDEIEDKKNSGRGLFMIGKRGNKYFIITSNKMRNSKLSNLQASLELINNSTAEELNRMHYDQLKNGKLSDKGGAGLGLIDIARKTKRKLQYNFIEINETYSYFLMKITIDKKKIS